MIKLVCKKCGTVWYTANTKDKSTCKCGGEMEEM